MNKLNLLVITPYGVQRLNQCANNPLPDISIQKIIEQNAEIINWCNDIKCSIDNLSCNISAIAESMQTVTSMLAHDNPMTIAAEYPQVIDNNRVVYTTEKVRFLDMLNPTIYILFKGVINEELPVYFKDTSEYEHIISLSDGGEPIMANSLVNNLVYTAEYVGNYIILTENVSPINITA